MTRLTIATLAAVMVLTACGIHNASERRATYLEAEAAYYQCIESGLTRAECVAGVFGESATANNY